MRVSRPKTRFMDFTFEHSEQGNRMSLNILGEELGRESYSFQIPRDEYRRGMWYVNGDHKRVGAGSRNWKKSNGVLCDRRMIARNWMGRSTKQ